MITDVGGTLSKAGEAPQLRPAALEAAQRINEDLEALAAVKDDRAKNLMLRNRGISPQSMVHLEGILERIRQIECLGDKHRLECLGDRHRPD